MNEKGCSIFLYFLYNFKVVFRSVDFGFHKFCILCMNFGGSVDSVCHSVCCPHVQTGTHSFHHCTTYHPQLKTHMEVSRAFMSLGNDVYIHLTCADGGVGLYGAGYSLKPLIRISRYHRQKWPGHKMCALKSSIGICLNKRERINPSQYLP